VSEVCVCVIFICTLVILGSGCRVGGFSREGIVVQDVLDGGNFCVIIVLL